MFEKLATKHFGTKVLVACLFFFMPEQTPSLYSFTLAYQRTSEYIVDSCMAKPYSSTMLCAQSLQS